MTKERITRTPNFMTRTTENRLRLEVIEMEQHISEVGKQMGEAAGINHDWHDNAAYDQAVRDYQLLQTRFAQLKSSLVEIEYIQPRK